MAKLLGETTALFSVDKETRLEEWGTCQPGYQLDPPTVTVSFHLCPLTLVLIFNASIINICAEIIDRFWLPKLFAINSNVCLLYKQCLILRNSTKHFNNTTPILYSIDSIWSQNNGWTSNIINLLINLHGFADWSLSME